MYLVSIYFDENAEKRIREYIRYVATKSGNMYMLDENVPPHMTVAAFEAKDEEVVKHLVENVIKDLKRGPMQWVSVGEFFPYVIYIAPVLNEYLNNIAIKLNEALSNVAGIRLSPYYQPYQWLPHTTIGKKLSKEEMQKAFEALQNTFGPFKGEVVRIGVAKTDPYKDILSWKLN